MSERDRVIDAFEGACHPVPSDEQVRIWRAKHPRHAAAIARHAEFMARRAPAARVAARASFVALLRFAATVSMDVAADAAEYGAIECALSGTTSERRDHVRALVDAALGAREAARAARASLPGEARRFRTEVRLPSDDATAMAWVGPVGELVTALDVDEAVHLSITVIRRSLAAPYGSEARERAWDELEEIAFAPCFETSSACRGGRDRRRVLLILWLSLRRRRPAAAAVVRRCLSLDRAWRAGGG